MKLDLAMPAYNEAPIIARAAGIVSATLGAIPNLTWHLTVVDNASTDGTAQVVAALGDPHVSALSIPTKGKGAAVVAAACASEGEVFGFIDADLSADPHHIAEFLEILERDEADVVIGSRLSRGARVDRGWVRTFSSRLFNTLRHMLLGVQVEDSQCGLKLTNARGKEELRACSETGWFFDVEWLSRLERKGLRINEVPITWKEELFTGREAKLRVLTDGAEAIIAFFRIRSRLSRIPLDGIE